MQNRTRTSNSEGMLRVRGNHKYKTCGICWVLLVVMFSSVVCDATEAEGGEGKGGGRAGPRDGPWRVEEVCDVVCDCDSVHGRVCCC